MKQAEPFLYPKLSSIYNKILQLVSAIILIVILMSLWLSTGKNDTENLSQHFTFIAKQQLQQATLGVAVLMEQAHNQQPAKNASIQRYLDALTKISFIKQAHLYDETGLLVVSSAAALNKDKASNELEPVIAQSKSINDLYGITPFQRNLSEVLTPFIGEIRDTTTHKLQGYLRFTIEKSYLTEDLAKSNEDHQSLQRLMLLIAGLVGFLLTRGLNRFSRRGYRLADKKAK